MFSLLRLMGQDGQILQMLEQIAQGAKTSVGSLRAMLDERSQAPDLDSFAATRRNEKQLVGDVSDLLRKSLVTALEREDIEVLADALYRIPKTVEKFAERYGIAAAHVREVDFSRQLKLMERAVETVLKMITAMSQGAPLTEIKQLNANIQKTESDADDVMLELLRHLYDSRCEPLKAVITKDLFELNEKVVDRCRDAGNVIVRVVLKNT